MLHTHQLVCKCRRALQFFQQSLGLPRFHSASAFHSHDARRALRLACMKTSLTPTCAGQTQAWSDGRSVSLLLQSSTAPEARSHQFHLLHLCQQMMDPRSHIVHRGNFPLPYLITRGYTTLWDKKRDIMVLPGYIGFIAIVEAVAKVVPKMINANAWGALLL